LNVKIRRDYLHQSASIYASACKSALSASLGSSGFNNRVRPEFQLRILFKISGSNY